MYTYISVYPLSISAVFLYSRWSIHRMDREPLQQGDLWGEDAGGSLPMNSAGKREASQGQGPLFSYIICKVDGPTPKRWRFVRGYDRPRLMGVASHRSFWGGIFIVLPINAGKYVLLTWIVIHVGNSHEGYWSSTLQIELLKLGTKTYCWWFRNPTENNHLGYIKLCIFLGGISTTVPSTLDRRIPTISSRKVHQKSKQVEESRAGSPLEVAWHGSLGRMRRRFFSHEKLRSLPQKKMSVRVRFCWVSWYL